MMLICVSTEMIPELVVPLDELEEEDVVVVVVELLEDVVVPEELLTEAVLAVLPPLLAVELPPLLVVAPPALGPVVVDPPVPGVWPPVPVVPEVNAMPGCDPHPAANAVVPTAARIARRAQRTATTRSMGPIDARIAPRCHGISGTRHRGFLHCKNLARADQLKISRDPSLRRRWRR
jgi:hypothetical protein